MRVLTDPVLRPRVMHLRRRWIADAALLRSLDAVLVSHVHFDHLDLPSLERLGRELPVVVPRGAGRLLRKRRFQQVLELDVGESVEIGSLTVRATQAEHDADRGPLGVKAPSLGFVVVGSKSVYFAGDTDLFEGMHALGELDVALLPIAGWGARIGPGHLGPRTAAEALARLRPRICVPIHWGTYRPIKVGVARLGAGADPVEEFVQAAGELAPGVDVRVLPRNGSLELV